jgi:hypothetical protein
MTGTANEEGLARHSEASVGLDPQQTNGKIPLWCVGPFTCELDVTADPPILCVSNTDGPVVEIVVLSTLDAEQQAQRLREVAERYLR